MSRSAARTDPETIVRTYDAAGTGVKAADKLWEAFGEGTTLNMADGVLTLSMIWQSAWTTGKGSSVPQAAIGPVDKAALQALYQDTTWVPSVALNNIAEHLAI
jgi:hypothetical protein